MIFTSLTRQNFRKTALLALMLLVFPIIAPYAAEPEKTVPKINVSGTASIDVAPDLAILKLGVRREAVTARAALDANNMAMSEVIESMKQAGIEARDLQTSNFSIQPRYVYHNPKKNEEQRPPKIVGYIVSNNLTVRLRDLTMVGKILDCSVTLGVNDNGNVQFTNDDPKQAISTARADAMKDALARARVLTKAAGVSLGPIISIDENLRRPQPFPIARAQMRMEPVAADSVPLEGGENSYTVTVNASWEIVQYEK